MHCVYVVFGEAMWLAVDCSIFQIFGNCYLRTELVLGSGCRSINMIVLATGVAGLFPARFLQTHKGHSRFMQLL